MGDRRHLALQGNLRRLSESAFSREIRYSIERVRLSALSMVDVTLARPAGQREPYGCGHEISAEPEVRALWWVGHLARKFWEREVEESVWWDVGLV